MPKALLAILLAALIAAAPWSTGPAEAQQASNRSQASRWCLSPRGVSVDMTIAGCGWLIENGALPGGNLFFAHLQRGAALAEKGQFEAAYSDFEAAERINPDDPRPAAMRARIREHLRVSQ
jgi:tetratricopeptide (TPR) repeat protein